MVFIYITFKIIFIFCCAVMAKRKNRDVALWAIYGAVGGLISYFIIASLPYLCPHCRNNFSKKSDGIHCGSCGKSDALNQDELAKLEEIKSSLAKKCWSVKAEGVKITVTQRGGAKLKFLGIESLERYIKN